LLATARNFRRAAAARPLLTGAAGAGAAVLGATLLEVRGRLLGEKGGRDAAPSDLARSVAARMTTPLLPDDYLHLLNPLWTAREIRGKVVKVVPETDDAATLVIKPGWGWSFDYLPGQYAGIGVQVDGRWAWRSYSITSAPIKNQGHIAITVKAMPEGLLSAHLVRGLDPGTIVRLALPQGEFVLPDPPPANVLFWTGGSGITPVMAMLRTLNRRGTMPDVVHIHSAPSQEQFIFGDELRAMAESHPNLRLVEYFDDDGGRFELSQLDAVCPDWRRRQVWVCGPAPILKAAETHWEKHGLGSHLHVERFSVTLSESASGGLITFAKSGKNTQADGATTLLEAGEKAGVPMPFGCRMGICHTCVAPLTKGLVKDLRNGNEYGQNQGIQTCITAAAGDCTIDL
ncbi:MAG TPA: ferredoxin reductase, partial [Acidimicrobiales bacterium]|nr:ferredoxin reductase [Acidimicrobiales bacterium]